MFTCHVTGYQRKLKWLPCEVAGCGTLTVTPPYCRRHTLTKLKVGIRANAEVDGRAAGHGLFALRDFKKGSMIAPIEGEAFPKAFLDSRYGSGNVGPYVVEEVSPRDVVIDPFNALMGSLLVYDGACERWIGLFANGHADLGRCNAMFEIAGFIFSPNIKAAVLDPAAMSRDDAARHMWLVDIAVNWLHSGDLASYIAVTWLHSGDLAT